MSAARSLVVCTPALPSTHSEWNAPVGLLSKERSLLGDQRNSFVHLIVRWGFYLYVSSIPFELPERGIPLEVHTITGSVFLLLALLQRQVCFGAAPRSLLWLGGFVAYYLVRLCATEHTLLGLHYFGNFLQIFFLFWASYNVLKDSRVAKRALLLFIASCTLLVVLGRLGFADVGGRMAERGAGRMTMFGQDPNDLASRLDVAIIVLIGMAFGGHLRYPFLIWPLVALYLLTIEYTGSRGAYIALFVGLATLAVTANPLRLSLKGMIIAGCICALVVGIAYRSGNMLGRLERSVEDGDMSGRERIYPEAWGMVLERPGFGFGPGDSNYELETRVADNHDYRDTHNLALEVLIACGLAGATPFFVCIFLCVRESWRGRRQKAGLIPLAACTMILSMSMTINLIASKTLWLMLAFGAAASWGVTVPPARQPTTAW
jgi:O-antigen ligase